MEKSPQEISDEAVAIIGIGCRFPGGAHSPEAYWDLLRNGIDAVVKVPHERWSLLRYRSDDLRISGRMITSCGGFLQGDIFAFDAPFFGLSPLEAECMDPQQRLMLEVTWEAFEQAGIDIGAYRGGDVGVYVGAFVADNMMTQFSGTNRESISSRTATSGSMSMISNRISHLFDFQGPSITVKTACSSSLVAIHLACRSLKEGACDLAVAGGVNLIFRPEYSIAMTKGGYLSPSGRCHPFSEMADGYVRGEGAGVVLLKPLSQALADGDTIIACIRASGINQDGHTPQGISHPSEAAQRRLIARVTRQAGISPDRLHYVEAHGTGTRAGDGTEAQSLGGSVAHARKGNPEADGPGPWVGAVKGNIGHLEAAAGVAGLIKAALCVNKREIPPNLHFHPPSSAIDFAALPLRFPLEPMALPEGEALWVGVNSFGYGGTNAHIILSSAPMVTDAPVTQLPTLIKDAPYLLPLSSHAPESLQALAGTYATHTSGADFPKDYGHTLACCRPHLRRRVVILAKDLPEWREGLVALAAGERHPALVAASGDPLSRRKVVFVFSGMGGQWWGMGRELFAQEPLFRGVLQECDSHWQALGNDSLISWFDPKISFPGAIKIGDPMGEPRHAQPANLALQIGLVTLWRAAGVTVDAVIGHSAGEIAASWAAGSLSMPSAWRLIHHRCHLQQSLCGQGAMAAVGLSVADMAVHLAPLEGRVEVAAVNAPDMVTVAGEVDAVAQLVARLATEGLFVRRLPIPVAYHTAAMAPLEARFRDALETLEVGESNVPLYSTVTGKNFKGIRQDTDYWWRNTRQPVLLADGLAALSDAEAQEGQTLVAIEIGPHGTLTPVVAEHLLRRNHSGHALPSQMRGESQGERFRRALAESYVRGVDLNWRAFYPSGRRLLLPSYPWHKTHLWKESEASRNDRLWPVAGPLLQVRRDGPEPLWNALLSLEILPWMPDHRIAGALIFPAAGYIAAMVEVCQNLGWPVSLYRFRLERALTIRPDVVLTIQALPFERKIAVSSRRDGDGTSWMSHCMADVAGAMSDTLPSSENPVTLSRSMPEEMTAEQFYSLLTQHQMIYGPTFRTLRHIWRDTERGIVLAQIDRFNDTQAPYPSGWIHPGTLDCAFQTLAAWTKGGLSLYTPFILISVGEIRFLRALPPTFWVLCHIRWSQGQHLQGDLRLMDAEGQLFGFIGQVQMLGLDYVNVRAGGNNSVPIRYYHTLWETGPTQENREAHLGHWVLVGFDAAQMAPLGSEIVAQGGRCDLIVLKEDAESIARLETTLEDLDGMGVVFMAAGGDSGDPVGMVQGWRLLILLQRLTRRPIPKGFLGVRLVTRRAYAVGHEISGGIDPAQTVLPAMMRVALNEFPDLECRSIDIDEGISPARLVSWLLEPSMEDEVVLRGEVSYCHRLVAQDPPSLVHRETNPEGFHLLMGSKGLLEDLHYEAMERQTPAFGEVEVAVVTCALNFKDVMKARKLLPPSYLAQISSMTSLGLECAGRVIRVGPGVTERVVGDEIIVFSTKGTFRSHVTVAVALTQEIPHSLDLSTAPCMVNFFTAYYALGYLGRLEVGERVLIHSGTGGVGLAAIQWACHKGAIIYATAGSVAKRDFLLNMGIKNVYDSHSLAFADEILRDTQGRGVDVALNVLAGEGLRRTLGIMAPFGRFVEIGKRDILARADLDLSLLERNVSFSTVDLDFVLSDNPDLIRRLLVEVRQHFAAGIFTALPQKSFMAADVVDAFRAISRDDHVGKIVVKLNTQPPPDVMRYGFASLFSPEKRYLITGGFGGFGHVLARWMGTRGARNLVLAGRSGGNSDADHALIHMLGKEGIQVEAVALDVSDGPAVTGLVQRLLHEPRSLHGLFHLAMILEDASLATISLASFNRVMAVKALGAWHLDQALNGHPLDYFVLFSSIACLLGNPGQGAYVAANAYLDALAQQRRLRGDAGISINWGGLAQTGVVARREGLQQQLEKIGIFSFSPEESMVELERVLGCNLGPQVGIALIDHERWVAGLPSKARRPRLSRLADLDTPGVAVVGSVMRAAYKLSPEACVTHITAALENLFHRVVGVAPTALAWHANCHDLGMDSLMGVELATALKVDFGIEITGFALMQTTPEQLRGQALAQIT